MNTSITRSRIVDLVPKSLLVCTLMLAATGQVFAHDGDMQTLLSRPQPAPFVGGQPVMVQGELEVLHGDDFAGTRSFVRYFVRSFATHQLFELGFDEEPGRDLLSGHKVVIRGRAMGSVIWAKDVVSLADSGETAQGSGTAAVPVLTERKALTILVNLTDATLCADPNTCTYTTGYVADKLYTATQSMSALYLNSSYGQLGFKADTNGDQQPDVIGPFQIGLSRVGCNYSSWASAADSAAQAAGANLSLYQHRIYVLPPYSQLPDCGWAGLANVGCGTYCRSWIAEPQSMMVYAHELGHNLNMAHAGTDPENDGVMNVEYGDSSDPMGSSRSVHNFNGAHSHQLGWLSTFANAYQSVTTSGTYNLAPIGTPPDGSLPQALCIAKPDSGDYYYLTYRQPTGFDSSLSSTYTRGVNIHRYKGSGYDYTKFINSLPDGGFFSDPANGITVSQTTHGTSSALIQVSFGCAAQSPSVAITPTTIWVKPGSTASLSAQITNRDAAGCSTTTFQLSASHTTGGTSAVTPASTSVAPGQGISASITVAGISSSGTITLTVKDSDGVDPGHSSDSQGTAQIAVDGTAPSAPTNLSSALVPKGVKLTWSAASDSGGSGVATYYVYRNGAKIGATTSLSYTDSTGTSGTTYTYTVTAVDGVGYESGNSNSATITTKSSKGGKPR